jgi:Uri superfamily endonuclease
VNFLPSSSGEYILELHLVKPSILQIGRLGVFPFPAGAYLYFGSARGPGGLRARLTRHLLPACSHPAHWHIDYLRAVAEVRAVGYLAVSCQEPAARHLECRWSQAVASLSGSLVPVPGFGASDCHSRCPAHLLAIQKMEAASGAVLLEPRMRKFLANAAGLPGTGQDLGWLKIDQSRVTPAGSCENTGHLR